MNLDKEVRRLIRKENLLGTVLHHILHVKEIGLNFRVKGFALWHLRWFDLDQSVDHVLLLEVELLLGHKGKEVGEHPGGDRVGHAEHWKPSRLSKPTAGSRPGVFEQPPFGRKFQLFPGYHFERRSSVSVYTVGILYTHTHIFTYNDSIWIFGQLQHQFKQSLSPWSNSIYSNCHQIRGRWMTQLLQCSACAMLMGDRRWALRYLYRVCFEVHVQVRVHC